MTVTSAKAQAHTQRVCSALLAQAQTTGRWLEQLTAEQFVRPSILPGKRVHDLVARIHLSAVDLTMTLQRPTTQRAVSIEQHLRSVRDLATADAHAAADVGGRLAGPELVRDFRTVVQRTAEELGSQLPAVVETRFDAVRSVDVLRAKLLELIVATDDLSRSVPELPAATLEPQAKLDATRCYAEVIGNLHPGRTVELRIPPAAAVQLATSEGGPTHKRGTPPTVVETDPLTFLRLCAGRLSWERAVATHAVAASGAHADLSPVFPVLALLV